MKIVNSVSKEKHKDDEWQSYRPDREIVQHPQNISMIQEGMQPPVPPPSMQDFYGSFDQVRPNTNYHHGIQSMDEPRL